MPGAAAVVAEHCRAHDYARPGKPPIAWDAPEACVAGLNLRRLLTLGLTRTAGTWVIADPASRQAHDP